MLSHKLRASVANTTIPVPTDPNFNQVSLLLHGDGTNGAQNNTFIDSSTNNFTVTRNGNTTQGTNTPFSQPDGAWSNYLNGSSYLTVANNTALNIPVATIGFTIELSFYLTSAQADMGLIDKYDAGGNGYILRLLPTGIRFYQTSGAVLQDRTYTFAQGAWYHVAVSYNGTNAAIYVNGVQQGATFACVTSNSTTQLNIGLTNTTSAYFIGYISNVRYVNGTGVYTANFTPPTAPLTAITNTSLLLSGTNAGIYDNAIKNDLETRGNAQVSTSVVKYGTGSMYFDGTGDYLSVPSNRQLVFEGDFTVEYWVYPTSNSSNGSVLSLTIGSYQNGIYLRVPTAGSNDSYYVNGVQSTVALESYFPLNTWTHLAIVRSGTSVKLYAAGVNISSVNKTVSGVVNSTAGTSTIGYETASGGTSYGYIDDFRITKGVARYTANFTPPTASFPNQ